MTLADIHNWRIEALALGDTSELTQCHYWEVIELAEWLEWWHSDLYPSWYYD